MKYWKMYLVLITLKVDMNVALALVDIGNDNNSRIVRFADSPLLSGERFLNFSLPGGEGFVRQNAEVRNILDRCLWILSDIQKQLRICTNCCFDLNYIAICLVLQGESADSLLNASRMKSNDGSNFLISLCWKILNVLTQKPCALMNSGAKIYPVQIRNGKIYRSAGPLTGAFFPIKKINM